MSAALRRSTLPLVAAKTPTTPPIQTSAALSLLLHYLQFSINLHSPRHAQQTHGLSFTLGLGHHPLLSTRLISAYSLLGLPSLSRLVLDSHPDKTNAFLWNSLLAAYSRNLLFSEPLSLFRSMLAHARPDEYTLAIVSKASGEVRELGVGRAIHSLVKRLGLGDDSVLLNSLMCMYFKCENSENARRLFDEMPVRSVASWNALISEYANSDDGLIREEAWELLVRMQMEGLKPDAFTISTVLPLCGLGSGSLFLRGKEIHGFALKNNFESGSDLDFHIGSGLIDMYCKCRNVLMGRKVFDEMVSKNVVAWTAMITGYVQNGEFEGALLLFKGMQLRDGIVPNKVTLLSTLSTVGSLANYMQGKEIHCFSIRTGLYGEVSLNNALIDMYFKCGNWDNARRIFDDCSWDKDTISWSTMIYGYGLHGRGDNAITLFHEMCNLGLNLDDRTWVGVISACGRSGLVTEGVAIYNSLLQDHHIIPTAELYSSIVDMLCRAGQLSQALDFIKSMPLEPSPCVWGALFVSAVTQGNLEVQNLAYTFLLQLQPENPSIFVALSNSLASSGKWDIVEEVRGRMRRKGLQKVAGCSWICVNNRVYSFYVEDKYHHCSKSIYVVLDCLILTLKGAGYVPDFEDPA